MYAITCLTTQHNPYIVGIAAAFCAFGSWVTASLFLRVLAATSRFQQLWLVLAGVSAGATVWCTHFVAMLAYQPAVPITYDPTLTAASLLVAIVGSSLGLWLASLAGSAASVVAGGAVLGFSIASMHYLGMAAYVVEGTVAWRMPYILLSIALAMMLGIWALTSARAIKGRHAGTVTAALLCLAILSLHFTGMGGLSIAPFAGSHAGVSGDETVLALSTIGVGVVVMVVALVANLIDVRSSRESMVRMQRMALSDSLTGLPNRAHFNERLQGAIEEAERKGWRLAALAIDLDRFKDINDLRGHLAGDQALRLVSERMSAVLREGEFLARIGGDEFAVIMRITDQSEALDLASRLHAAICESVKLEDGIEAIMDASIGIAFYPEDGSTAEALLGNADLAMYRAKANPAETVCVYKQDMDEAVRQRRQIINDLRVALGNDEFELFYQVQTSLETHEVLGYEALLRWHHPERGTMTADEFIPTAEETGLILPVGEWILRRACQDAMGWNSPDRVSVNLSAVQFAHSDLPGLVARTLADTGLPADRLELELTETTFMAEPDRNVEILRQIRAMGITIALDDFGTGYSSLSTLRKFRFDRIKLDKSFVADCETDPQSKAIIRAVLALGNSLGIPILAEGVETEEQLAFLLYEGCHEVQGYLIGRPSRMESGRARLAAVG